MLKNTREVGGLTLALFTSEVKEVLDGTLPELFQLPHGPTVWLLPIRFVFPVSGREMAIESCFPVNWI